MGIKDIFYKRVTLKDRRGTTIFREDGEHLSTFHWQRRPELTNLAIVLMAISFLLGIVVSRVIP